MLATIVIPIVQQSMTVKDYKRLLYLISCIDNARMQLNSALNVLSELMRVARVTAAIVMPTVRLSVSWRL